LIHSTHSEKFRLIRFLLIKSHSDIPLTSSDCRHHHHSHNNFQLVWSVVVVAIGYRHRYRRQYFSQDETLRRRLWEDIAAPCAARLSPQRDTSDKKAEQARRLSQ
jgi:hypothetical protein